MDRAYKLELSDNNTKLYSIGVDKNIHCWDLTKMEIIHRFKPFQTFDFDTAFKVHSINKYFIGFFGASYGGNSLTKVNLKRKYIFIKFPKDISNCHSCSINENLNHFVFGNSNGNLCIVNSNNLKMMKIIKSNERNKKRINSIIFDKTRNHMIVAGFNNRICIFDCNQNYNMIKYITFKTDLIHLSLESSGNLLSVGSFSSNENNHNMTLVNLQKLHQLNQDNIDYMSDI